MKPPAGVSGPGREGKRACLFRPDCPRPVRAGRGQASGAAGGGEEAPFLPAGGENLRHAGAGGAGPLPGRLYLERGGKGRGRRPVPAAV